VIYYLRVDVLTNSYQMEGMCKFGRTEDGSGGCGGKIVVPAGGASGATEGKFSTEEFSNCADYCGLKSLNKNWYFYFI
jgi:hypothetical protein